MQCILLCMNTGVLIGVWTNAYIGYKNINNQIELKKYIKLMAEELKN